MSYKFTVGADAALDTILLHIALDNRAAALRMYDQIVETCELLAEISGIGKHPDFSEDPELMHFPVKKYSSYIVFYRKQKKYIDIVDIVHGARNLPA